MHSIDRIFKVASGNRAKMVIVSGACGDAANTVTRVYEA